MFQHGYIYFQQIKFARTATLLLDLCDISINQLYNNFMDRVVQKYPYKKPLFLNWYQAAIGHLLLFKYLKQKFSNNAYFLISEQGIMLKATSQQILRTVDEQVNKFFAAKIQELEINASADFYDHIIDDIKDQTQRLKDSRDCPYINLVYSQKLKHSCLAMKKYGYCKPYEFWQSMERQKKGFCYLLVRPQHRWKQIANNVHSLVKKRQGSHQKGTPQTHWPIDMGYEKFIWFFLKKDFKNIKKCIEIKEKKLQNILTITIKKDIPQLCELEKEIDCLNFAYYSERPNINKKYLKPSLGCQKGQPKAIVISTLQLERITELIYHEFGLSKLVRDLRRKSQNYLVIAAIEIAQIQSTNMDNAANLSKQKSGLCYELQTKQDIRKINQAQIVFISKLGRRHQLVTFQGRNFVSVQYQKPLLINISMSLKIRIPCIPKYFYWYETQDAIYMLRHYFATKFTQKLEDTSLSNGSAYFGYGEIPLKLISFSNQQLQLLYSFFCIIRELHQRQIFAGKDLVNHFFVQQNRVICDVGQQGSKSQDIYKCSQLFMTNVNSSVQKYYGQQNHQSKNEKQKKQSQKQRSKHQNSKNQRNINYQTNQNYGYNYSPVSNQSNSPDSVNFSLNRNFSEGNNNVINSGRSYNDKYTQKIGKDGKKQQDGYQINSSPSSVNPSVFLRQPKNLNIWGRIISKGRNERIGRKIEEILKNMVDDRNSSEHSLDKLCEYLQKCLIENED